MNLLLHIKNKLKHCAGVITVVNDCLVFVWNDTSYLFSDPGLQLRKVLSNESSRLLSKMCVGQAVITAASALSVSAPSVSSASSSSCKYFNVAYNSTITWRILLKFHTVRTLWVELPCAWPTILSCLVLITSPLFDLFLNNDNLVTIWRTLLKLYTRIIHIKEWCYLQDRQLFLA